MDIKIARTSNGANAAYSLTFDDGCYYDSTLKTIEIFEDVYKKTGIKIKATSLQTVHFLHERLIALWKEAIAKGYYDITSHSMDHAFAYNDSISYERRYNDAKESKEELEKIYNVPVITYGNPGGVNTKDGCEVLGNFYYANRSNAEYTNDIDNLDYLYLGSYIALLEHKTVKPFADFIDSVIKNNGYAIQVNHWLTERDDDKFHCQRTDVFHDECIHLANLHKEGKIWLASFNDAVKYFLERDKTTLNISEVNGEYVVENVCPLPSNIFDMPLTLVVSSEDKAITVKSDGITNIYEPVNSEVLIKVKPNSTIIIK